MRTTVTDLYPTQGHSVCSATHRRCEVDGCDAAGTDRVSSRDVATRRVWRAEEVRHVCRDHAARMRGEVPTVVRLEDLPPIVPHPLAGKPKPKRAALPAPVVKVAQPKPVKAPRALSPDARDRSGYPMCSTEGCPRRSHTKAGKRLCTSCAGKAKRERERASGLRRARVKREPRPCVDCGRELLIAAWGRCKGCDSKWRKSGGGR